jgi:hypothetical protein
VPDNQKHQDEQDDDAAKKVVEVGLALASLMSIHTDEWHCKAGRLVQAGEGAGVDVQRESNQCYRGKCGVVDRESGLE